MQLSLTTSLPATESVTSAPRQLLKAEGLIMLLGGLVAWRMLDGSWGWFAALFLVPDLSLLGYLVGPRFGAAAYNTGHSLVGPAVLALLGFNSPAVGAWTFLAAALWVAHIGFDRMLGYGLKYASSFNDTHLGRVGR